MRNVEKSYATYIHIKLHTSHVKQLTEIIHGETAN